MTCIRIPPLSHLQQQRYLKADDLAARRSLAIIPANAGYGIVPLIAPDGIVRSGATTCDTAVGKMLQSARHLLE